MRIKAVYENGVIKPLQPLGFKGKEIQIDIIIPDWLLEKDQGHESTTPMRKKIDDILGKYARRRPTITPREDKKLWHRHLEKKYCS